jgi:hypothetical protein
MPLRAMIKTVTGAALIGMMGWVIWSHQGGPSASASAGEPCAMANGKALVLAMRYENDSTQRRLDLTRDVVAADPVQRRVRELQLQTERDPVMDKLSADTMTAMVDAYKNECQSGDVIMVPHPWGAVVNTLCDFSKSILKGDNATTCVMR